MIKARELCGQGSRGRSANASQRAGGGVNELTEAFDASISDVLIGQSPRRQPTTGDGIVDDGGRRRNQHQATAVAVCDRKRHLPHYKAGQSGRPPPKEARQFPSPRSAARWRNRPQSTQKAVSEAERTNTWRPGPVQRRGRASRLSSSCTSSVDRSQTNLPRAQCRRLRRRAAGEAAEALRVVALGGQGLAEQPPKATDQISSQVLLDPVFVQPRPSAAIKGITATISEINEIAARSQRGGRTGFGDQGDRAQRAASRRSCTAKYASNVSGFARRGRYRSPRSHQVLTGLERAVQAVRDDAR